MARYVLLFLLLTSSRAQKDQKFFRQDYTYLDAMQSFYKMHTIHKSWHDALDVCEMEGATLFYPRGRKEADIVREFWNKTQPFDRIYIAVSSLIVKGVFETIDGNWITDVYNHWAPGEPNDSNGMEDCVVMRKDGTLNDVNCESKSPFVCKKTLDSLEWNSFCSIPYLGYTYQDSSGKCYKLHMEAKTWQDAYATCSHEQSYLAVIDSQEEADYLANMTESIPNKNQDLSAVHVGFHKRPNGWTTVKGKKLEESGYAKWGQKQPDNNGGDENCGAMHFSGELSDVTCSRTLFFICEHDVSSLGSSIFDKLF